ncbi:MAG: hypothetical protein WC842_03365 [Candidatus Paceibacterota bacterium]|jgi:hypothetical protein
MIQFEKNLVAYRMVEDLGMRTNIPKFQPLVLEPLPFIFLGKCEAETVANDLLKFCVAEHNWVGVSVKDYALLNQCRIRDWFRKIKWLKYFGHMTDFPETSEKTFRMLSIYGGSLGSFSELTTIKGFPVSVINGIKLLVKNDLAVIVSSGREDVLCPTEKLITKALAMKN